MKKKKELKPVKIPRKPVVLSILLLIAGVILIIVGIIKISQTHKFSSAAAYWVIGLLSFVPGVFYLFKILKACFTKNVETRNKNLQEIPQD
mmetsp:Transcript_795/g.732  ORF Transcript_795/g.732 Transcript_795/m.732 type:complete len:91 (-) Transcript_795:180-452(-)